MEIWKPLVGMEGWYEVSDLGRIRRIMPAKKAIPGRIVKQQANPKGYKLVTLTMACEKKTFTVHRAVLEAFVCPRPSPEIQANHKDGRKSNNRLSNLEWSTPGENLRHSYKVCGRKAPIKKLTPARVLFIRKHAEKYRHHQEAKKLAARFGVSAHTIGQIAIGSPHSGWAWLK